MQKRDVLIIGAGIGGMQAALNVADKGFKVVLLDKSLSIGGSMAKIGFKDRAVDMAVRRLEQAEETGAEYIVSACSFCYQDLLDGIARSKSPLKMINIMELVKEAMKNGGD